jgi:Holliday junction resolvase RusA-like endonuclease
MTARWSEEDLADYKAKREAPLNGTSLAQNASPALQVGRSYRFVVLGVPEPGGSKRALVPLDKDKNPYRRGNGGIVVSVKDANPRAEKWKKHVSKAAREEYGGPRFDGPVAVRFVFYLPRPKGHYGTGANSNRLKASSPKFPIGPPDVLKLSRPVEDGLTQAGNVFSDDARIVDEDLKKRYGHPSRVEVTIEEILVSDPNEQPELFQQEERMPWE